MSFKDSKKGLDSSSDIPGHQHSRPDADDAADLSVRPDTKDSSSNARNGLLFLRPLSMYAVGGLPIPMGGKDVGAVEAARQAYKIGQSLVTFQRLS